MNLFYISQKIQEFVNPKEFDLAILVGDRMETLAVGIALHFMGLEFAHIGGGAITIGSLDQIYRYGITTFATLHYATSKESYKNLKSLPFLDKKNIFFIGYTGIEAIKSFQTFYVIINKLIHNLPKKYILCTVHPNPGENELLSKFISEIPTILDLNSICLIITQTNNDFGSDKIINAINRIKDHPKVYFIKNLGATGYYSAINDSLFLVGNSSSGIIEAPYFCKICVNLGSRQEKREER